MEMLPRVCFAFALVAASCVCGADVKQAADVESALHEKIDLAISNAHVGALSPIATDAEFLRRIYLHLVGRTPTADEAREFLVSESVEDGADRRAAVINRLLASDEFNDYFSGVLDVMLMERRGGVRIPIPEWQAFLRQAVSDEWPYDRIVRTIITADGTGEFRGAAKWLIQREVEPNALTRDIGRLFLGRDLQCAQCHDHPNIGDYEQSEYYGILSFLNRSYLFEDESDNKKSYVGEKADGDVEYVSVFAPDEDPSKSMPFLLTGLTLDVEPRYDGDDPYVIAPSKTTAGLPKFSRRAQLARLITHPDNQHFARNSVNRLWAHMMGRGIVHPVDFHHSDNPPSHPELLTTLANRFVATGFNIREMLRQIALSDTYQRSVDFPTGSEMSLDDITRQLHTIDNEKSRLDKMGRSDVRAGVESQLSARRKDLAEVDAAITDAAKELSKREASRETTKKEVATKQKQLSNLQSQQKSLVAAESAAKVVAESFPKDESLREAHVEYKKRVATVKKQVGDLKKVVEQLKSTLATHESEVNLSKRKLARLRADRIGLADMVAESRGAVRLAKAAQRRRDSAKDDLRQQRHALELHREYVLKTRAHHAAVEELKQEAVAGDSGCGELEEAVATAAGELKLAETRLRDSWERRFAVRSLTALSPEQLAGSTVAALELRPRFELGAEAEWAKKYKGKKPEEVPTGDAKDTEIQALAQKRIDQVHSTYVSVFAAPGGAPQDVFSSTADQALFFSNDGRVQNWLGLTEGGLLHRLSKKTEASEIADEIYLAILCRQPADDERRDLVTYLDQRGKDRGKAIREIAWSLLSSIEFRFNH